MRRKNDTRGSPAATAGLRGAGSVGDRRPAISSVRITDAAGDLVAEFSSSSPDTAERLIVFWQSQLPGETLTIERGLFEHQPPSRWTNLPAAEEAYAGRLPRLLPERRPNPSDLPAAALAEARHQIR